MYVYVFFFPYLKSLLGNSLAIQRLGLCAFSAVGPNSAPGWGTKILQALLHSQKTKQNKTQRYVIQRYLIPGFLLTYKQIYNPILFSAGIIIFMLIFTIMGILSLLNAQKQFKGSLEF